MAGISVNCDQFLTINQTSFNENIKKSSKLKSLPLFKLQLNNRVSPKIFSDFPQLLTITMSSPLNKMSTFPLDTMEVIAIDDDQKLDQHQLSESKFDPLDDLNHGHHHPIHWSRCLQMVTFLLFLGLILFFLFCPLMDELGESMSFNN